MKPAFFWLGFRGPACNVIPEHGGRPDARTSWAVYGPHGRRMPAHALEGWSSVIDRTNRKHCPSHEIRSYKRDGRWRGWSFDRGSTVSNNSQEYCNPFVHPTDTPGVKSLNVL